MKITRTIQKQVNVTKIIDINEFPLTKAPNATTSFVLKDGKDVVKFKKAKINPNNSRVYIVSLFKEDLLNLIQLDGTSISKKDIKNNLFYVMEYQLA